MKDRPCVWMQTGVVPRKDCDRDYACSDCLFESAMRRAVKRNADARKQGTRLLGRATRIVPWEEKVKWAQALTDIPNERAPEINKAGMPGGAVKAYYMNLKAQGVKFPRE